MGATRITCRKELMNWWLSRRTSRAALTSRPWRGLYSIREWKSECIWEGSGGVLGGWLYHPINDIGKCSHIWPVSEIVNTLLHLQPDITKTQAWGRRIMEEVFNSLSQDNLFATLFPIDAFWYSTTTKLLPKTIFLIYWFLYVCQTATPNGAPVIC